MTTKTYTESTFWSAFRSDLEKTKGHLIIQSPFVSPQRLKLVANDFKSLAARNVTVCIFIQRPKYWDTPSEKLSTKNQYEKHELLANIEEMKKWNCHVNLKSKIHSKFAIHDHRVMWEGSLNKLSHLNGLEHMRRWEDPFEAKQIIVSHELLNCQACIKVISLFSPGYPNPEPDAKQFGEWLKRNRIEAEMTHRQLESLSGVSRRTICNIEQGSDCFLNTAASLIEHLNLELCMIPNYLLPSIAQMLHNEMAALRAKRNSRKSTKRRMTVVRADAP